MAVVRNQELTEASPEAATVAAPVTALLMRSTSPRRVPGGDPREGRAGNPNPSARESENVAGPPERAKIRRTIAMGSSVG